MEQNYKWDEKFSEERREKHKCKKEIRRNERIRNKVNCFTRKAKPTYLKKNTYLSTLSTTCVTSSFYFHI